MKKSLLCIMTMLLILFFTSCDSSKYSHAVSAYNSEDYESAIALFEELGDYGDSKKQFKTALESYIVELRHSRDWEKATIYLEKYQTLVSKSEYEEYFYKRLEDFVSCFCYDKNWEKAKTIVDDYRGDLNVSHLYDQITYEHGINLLEKEQIDEGLTKLSLIKSDSSFYASAQNAITDYNNLKTSPLVQRFLGSWNSQTKAMGLVFKSTLYFELKYNRVVCYESCDQDGFVISSEHNLYYDDFFNDGAVNGKFSCRLKNDGSLYYGGYYYTKR